MARQSKVFPVLIVIIIAAVLAALFYFVALPIIEREIDMRTPNDERVNLRTYLELSEDDAGLLMFGAARASSDVLVRDGAVYWDAENIGRYLLDELWVHMDEQTLFLTTADEVILAKAGESFYIRHAEAVPAEGVKPEIVRAGAPVFFIEKGQAYISFDFAKRFSNFTYELFANPYRVQLYADDAGYTVANLVKNTELRVLPDIKSGIVCDLDPYFHTVFILEQGDGWSYVRTRDGFVGYVENRRLGDILPLKITVPKDYVPPPYTELTEDRPLCIGWDVLAASLSDIVENAWPLDVVSPTWYKITDASGAVNSLARKSYVEEAHARGLKVWPLIDDFSSKYERADLLMSTESRNNFVSYIIGEAKELGFDGINLDFEDVPMEAASGYEQLIRELSVACRTHGLVFSIDNYPPRPRTEHYNRGLQGKVADYVIIMGYDEHWSVSSGTGSVASFPFVVDAIEQTTAVVPAHKVINAVPFYTRIWSTARDGTVRIEATPGHGGQARWLAARNLEPYWSEELGQNYVQTDENSKLYQIWLEDEASMQKRIDAMKDYGLGGVACWRLGLETPEIWDILGEYTRGAVQ